MEYLKYIFFHDVVNKITPDWNRICLCEYVSWRWLIGVVLFACSKMRQYNAKRQYRHHTLFTYIKTNKSFDDRYESNCILVNLWYSCFRLLMHIYDTSILMHIRYQHIDAYTIPAYWCNSVLPVVKGLEWLMKCNRVD